MMDPSNVFKDAVDGLFQGAMIALNGWNNRPWHCLALTWHPILSWHLPTRAHAVYHWYRWWILQISSRMEFYGLFQGAMMALNGYNDMPLHYLALVWHPILSWQLTTCTQTAYPQLAIAKCAKDFDRGLTSIKGFGWGLIEQKRTIFNSLKSSYNLCYKSSKTLFS